MTEKTDRRDAVKTVAAAGGLLLLGGLATADEPEAANSLSGEWFNGGKLEQPCAIFQQGRVLLLINERGDIASAQMTEANQFTVLRGWQGEAIGRAYPRHTLTVVSTLSSFVWRVGVAEVVRLRRASEVSRLRLPVTRNLTEY
jgi:hypothetical protein